MLFRLILSTYQCKQQEQPNETKTERQLCLYLWLPNQLNRVNTKEKNAKIWLLDVVYVR